MRYRMEAACACHTGLVRRSNEDNLYFDGKILEERNQGLKDVVSMQAGLEAELCLAVFDGMGGEEKGETAAFLAAQTLQKEVERFQDYFRTGGQFLLNTCLSMNAAICAEAEACGGIRMGSTAVMLLLRGLEAYVCNIGDSPAYLLREGVLYPLFEKHVEKAAPNAALFARKKPRLSQHLGIAPDEMTIMPYIAKGDLQAGDCLLLCTDGLSESLDKEALRSALAAEQSVKACVEGLLADALAQGGRDNISIIVCRVLEEGRSEELR